jgi:tetratricopeptide (TPR) repeat protein
LYLGRCFLCQETGRHEQLLEAVDLAAVRFPDEEMSGALISYAHAYLSDGHVRKALDVAEVLARHFPEDPAASALLARCRLYSGDLEGARRVYGSALRREEKNPVLTLEAAQADMLARDWLLALDRLEKVKTNGEMSGEALFLASFAAVRARPERVRTYLDPFLAGSEGRAGHTHRSAAQLSNLLRDGESSTARAWLDLGTELGEAGLFGAALASWETGLEMEPASRETLVTMGNLYGRLKLADQAGAAYGAAIEVVRVEEQDETARAAIIEDLRTRSARVLAWAGRYDEARAAFESLADPSAVSLELALVCESQGDMVAAKRWLEKAAEDEETAGEARYRLKLLNPETPEADAGSP